MPCAAFQVLAIHLIDKAHFLMRMLAEPCLCATAPTN
jgi:hypothetical protein